MYDRYVELMNFEMEVVYVLEMGAFECTHKKGSINQNQVRSGGSTT